MAPTFKPDGYPTVSPYLVVDGADRAIQSLTTVFSATELRRFTDDPGTDLRIEWIIFINNGSVYPKNSMQVP